jgi:transcriptional regulator with XRE-family HTH domain
MKEKIAERIRIQRLMKGLSQQNMADELGITVAAFSNIERGVTDITVTRLLEICKILNYSVTQFLDYVATDSNALKDNAASYGYDQQKIDMILQQLNFQQQEMELLKAELKKLKP